MPLQNRVDPFGEIHAVPARGMFTGNRGVIHDPQSRKLLGRRWTTKAWIICDLVHPKGTDREVMGRNARSGGAGWTELFFLDEVTALAAGHRPCFYCRREAAIAFRDRFRKDRGEKLARAPEMDAVLHAQRPAAGRTSMPLSDAGIRSLPDGAMVAFGNRAFALRGGALLPWSFAGYGKPPEGRRGLPDGARLLTPPATVAALKAGYMPAWHESAA